MRDFLYKESRPVFGRLIKAARESDRDSLVKKLDLIKDQYEIDETNIMMSKGGMMTMGRNRALKIKSLCLNR